MSEQPAEQGTSPAPGETKTINFTDSESKIFMSMMSNLTGDIPFDAEAVAKELGYKDGSIVKTRWSQIRRKKLSGGAPTGGIKKRTPKKAAKEVDTEDAGADDDEATTPATPTKTPKKRGRKPKVKQEVKDEESEDVGKGGIAED